MTGEIFNAYELAIMSWIIGALLIVPALVLMAELEWEDWRMGAPDSKPQIS